MTTPFVQVRDLHKHYQLGPENLHVLRGVDLDIQKGEWLTILGASGSGKSTLLHLIGGLDTPDQGTVHFAGQDLFDQSASQRDRFRNRRVGFVFQFYYMLPELNVVENTILSHLIGGGAKPDAKPLLERMGLGGRLKHRPRELSGGERQRVAIARALINHPDLLLADEPTGNLDHATGDRILDLLCELHGEGQTIVMVTHDPRIADRADRTLRLVEGQLATD